MYTLEIRPLRADELPRAAAFLARLNRIPEHHIGFCGIAEAEILDSWQQDFGDVPAADAFVALHDALFPGTYYDGRDILGRLSEQHQVLTAHDEAGLCGYVYTEVSPAFGEASLEFIGVAPRARGKGVGTRLVREALAWVFSFNAVAEVSLVVSTRREAALRLYRAAGFELEHEMRSFLKTWS